MVEVAARCTQCGSEAFGSREKNNNYYEYTVRETILNHGGGKAHGTEELPCPTCGEETVHNRCGKSVPRV